MSVQKPMDYTLFEATPGLRIVVLPDTPAFTVVTVSNDFLKATGFSGEQLKGKGLFTFFPGSTIDPAFAPKATVQEALVQVLKSKESHSLNRLRCDVPAADGTFVEKYWKVHNVPVLDDAGNVNFIILTVEDISAPVVAGKREERYKNVQRPFDLFMQAPVAVCIVSGPNFIVQLANEGMLEILGRTSEMIGKPLESSLTEMRTQGLMKILNHVYATGETYHAPTFPATLLINGEREKRYFDLVFKPYYLEKGDPVPAGIYCVAYNITRQILAQKEVERSEHRFRTLIENATVATGLYVGPELTIQYANDILTGSWGRDSSVIGKPLEEAVPELKGQPFLHYLENVFATGIPYTGVEEEAWLKVDGKLQSFYFNFTYKALRDNDGKVYGIHHMSVDVTGQVLARKELEERKEELQLAIDVADLGTFTVDLLTNMAVYSKRVMDWFGFSRQGHSMEEIQQRVHPDDRPQVISALALNEGSKENRHHDVSYRVVNPKDNVTRYLRSFGRMYFTAGGKPYKMVGMIQEVTQQMLYQQFLQESEAELQRKVTERTHELEKVNEELRRTNNNLEEFAYAASHDLKEPIRKVQVFTDRLKEELTEKLSADQNRLFERVENAAQRMSNLIDDLITFSHVGRVIMNVEPVNLNEKVQGVLEDLELEIDQKAAEIRVGPLPVISGQKRQLQQLFQNLVGNALKYSKPGEAPQISITSPAVSSKADRIPESFLQDGNRYCLIEVRDNGIGFEKQDAERIFNVFTRLHGNTEYRGTGVGLSIAQKVVQNHGGYIWAEGEVGKGASFFILFPAA
jgi:signal transduction histidine kinase